jgi:hypothetical protein
MATREYCTKPRMATASQRFTTFTSASRMPQSKPWQASALHGSDTNFIQMSQEVGWLVINTVGAGPFEFILAIAA